MATESPEATVKDILTDSTSGTGLASKHYAVGLLYVHGIGQQKRGETISEFADACYGLVQDRIRGIAEGHSNRRTTRETLDKAAPQAAQVPDIRAPSRALRQYLVYLQSAYNFKPEAKLTAELCFGGPSGAHTSSGTGGWKQGILTSLTQFNKIPDCSPRCLEPILPRKHAAIVPRSASPFAADALRRARMDWAAMSKHGRVEAKRGDLALAASSFLDILKSYWIAEPQDVHADIACDQ